MINNIVYDEIRCGIERILSLNTDLSGSQYMILAIQVQATHIKIGVSAKRA